MTTPPSSTIKPGDKVLVDLNRNNIKAENLQLMFVKQRAGNKLYVKFLRWLPGGMWIDVNDAEKLIT